MRVAFDGICLHGPVTGVARAFLTGLSAYAARHDDCVLLLPEGATLPAGLRIATAPAPRGALRRQLALPRLLRRLGADVLHSPVAAVPLGARCPSIATVHDLPWLHAGLGEPDTAWRRFATRRALAAARAVIAPSIATAADVRRLAPHVDCRIVPHATPPVAATPSPRRGPFVALGDDRPRKNRDRVRAAHELAQGQRPALPSLRFVGPPDDYVDEAEKSRLLAHCRAAVQCSRFEGFGLPVLEALAHGAPLVCSDLPAHREIAGDGALFVDPLDPAAIAAALLRIDGDEALRARLAAAGPRRAAAFAPDGVAAAWRSLHEEVRR